MAPWGGVSLWTCLGHLVSLLWNLYSCVTQRQLDQQSDIGAAPSHTKQPPDAHHGATSAAVDAPYTVCPHSHWEELRCLQPGVPPLLDI